MFCLRPPKRGAAFGAICRGVITSFISRPAPLSGAPSFPPVCWEGLGRAGISELHCWPHSACPLHPPHGLLCSCHWCNEPEGLSCTHSLALSLSSNAGTRTPNRSFHVLGTVRARSCCRAGEGLAQPRGSGTGSYVLPAPCLQGVSAWVEVCVLGACCRGSYYPVEQFGWHRQIRLQAELLKPYNAASAGAKLAV